jgi:hydroxymethylpyrimidine kinase/phosphomethylpyrimidine kinase/thiamine-phosphate diphosphorylase
MSATHPTKPVVLTIAGSDCAGMAGVQMDIRTLAAMGVHGATTITANTAQNNREVLAIQPVDSEVLAEQLRAVETLPIAAIKVGLIPGREQLTAICNFVKNSSAVERRSDIKSSGAPLVIDPVLAGSCGDALTESDLTVALKSELLPLCTLLTPNRQEAEQLSGLPIHSSDDVETAARALLATGAKAVLLKGGHGDGSLSQDFFCSREQSFWLTSPRQESTNNRGTGCALSSAIAAALALGYALADAVVIGKMAINQGLRQGYGIAGGGGPVAISHFPNRQHDLPLLTRSANVDPDTAAFPPCADTPLGLYPIVDRAEWLARLRPTGISTVQLRVKDLEGDALRQEIAEAIEIGRHYNCRLFINDHWQLAVELGAYGVHLGQEDLDEADIEAIRDAGLRLGISSHCHYEVARAHSFNPSYIACGPIYHTNTKDMPWTPQGLAGLSYWQDMLDYPLVAIGGINRERMPSVAVTGVSGVAMITAITLADDPEQTCREFHALLAAAIKPE